MRASVAAVVALLAAACASQGAAPEERSGRSAQAIVGGATDGAHDAVVSIVTAPDASNPELCSGVVVAPRVVLTAGHCTRGQDAASLTVGVGTSAAMPARTIGVASVVTYPGFGGSFDDVMAGLDLGALVLSEDANVEPLPLYGGDEGALVGQHATAVGFGQSNAGDIDTRGTRRQADVTIASACSALLGFGDATTNACHGDSGGPLLVGAVDGGEAVAGVISFGDELACATPSYAVRVDRYAAWIADVVAGAATDGGACADCPPRAVDCTTSADASAPDAAPDAPETADAGVTLPEERLWAGGGGGCDVGRSGVPLGAAPIAFVLVALIADVRRRANGRPWTCCAHPTSASVICQAGRTPRVTSTSACACTTWTRGRATRRRSCCCTASRRGRSCTAR